MGVVETLLYLVGGAIVYITCIASGGRRHAKGGLSSVLSSWVIGSTLSRGGRRQGSAWGWADRQTEGGGVGAHGTSAIRILASLGDRVGRNNSLTHARMATWLSTAHGVDSVSGGGAVGMAGGFSWRYDASTSDRDLPRSRRIERSIIPGTAVIRWGVTGIQQITSCR